MPNTNFSINLDIDSDTIKQLPSLTNPFNTFFSLITKPGPAGGNPIYKFSSNSKSDLELFLNTNYHIISPTSGIISVPVS